ncbi:MAG: hypothetical protein QF406_02430 [Verrucomicrobiota bacterium]|jgi:hypothetical protein|nr:hypothetical protein [Verrucomicrobiota bacterium]
MKLATANLMLCALFLTACQSPDIQPAPEFDGDLIAAGKKEIANAPPRNKNLYRLITAVHALKLRQNKVARELFDSAMPSAGQILKSDASTRMAQSLFSPENVKGFHGEPYERAMGWFYRGVIYWMDGEAENARACFRTAQLMDALAEKAEHRADWVILDYLDGFITTKLGKDGAEALKRAQSNAGETKLSDYNRNNNVMFILQTGFGPVKKSGGDVGEELIYDGGHSGVHSIRVTVKDQLVTVPIFDNLTHQASTRGNRAMDMILARKATVKKTADTIGDIGTVPGVVLADFEDTREAGLTLLGMGLIGKFIGGSVEPRADTRTWNNLPQHLSFASLQLPMGKHQATIEFLDRSGTALPEHQKSVILDMQTGRDTVVFVADQ